TSFAQGSASAPIEVVPSHGKALITPNNGQTQSPDQKNFNELFPSAPRPFLPDASPQDIPLLPPERTVTRSQQQQDLIDRRKNWVFVTADDLMQDSDPTKALGVKEYEKNGEEKRPTTAMERFYQRLYNADHASLTNGFSPWNKKTNSVTGKSTADGDAH